MRPIRLLLVDDHPLFRRGLVALLGQSPRLHVCGEAGSVGEALRWLRDGDADVILLDNHLPGVRGVDAVAALREAAPHTSILMLTVSEDAADLATALRAGAAGYLLKTTELDQLCEAVERVVAVDSVISPPMLNKLVTLMRQGENADTSATAVDRPHTREASNTQPAATPQVQTLALASTTVPASSSPVEGLSEREREILVLIARGQSNKMIARSLDIAETTVKIHVQHILRKLGVSTRVQAAVVAVNSGLG